ncbi:Spermatid-associated protein [Chaetura pelagica]|uniref:spermatid-associated protein n=1 Tax=Chaetura pelagica TaxID=8897 RepID=UPI0005233A7D|nr:PREDICTED: spermatid-associated protein [Chaetura pelagica]KFU92005.1 Spermatid-associated protein [Chaetura pelagica]
MSAFNLANQCMQRAEPGMECMAPRMKLRDEVFVFVDGKWVNEMYCQPPFASHQKLFGKKAQNEWGIWEENRTLWEENQVLRIENRMLWEENKALQCVLSQNKPVQVIYTDAIQQSLQQENNPFPFIQERNMGFPVNPGNTALQAVQGKNRVLGEFQPENKSVPIICKDQKAIAVHEENKNANSDLHEDTVSITSVEEGNPGLEHQQGHEANKESTTSTQNKTKSFPSIQGECEVLRAVQDLYEFLHIFLEINLCHGKKQDRPILYDVDRSFREDYKKLKRQLSAVKNTVSDITFQMAMLENELIAITRPAYEGEREQLAAEHQLGEM